MEEKLNKILEDLASDLSGAATSQEVAVLKGKYLGKSSAVLELLKGLKDVPASEKPALGAKINKVKQEIEAKINDKEKELKTAELNAKLASEKIDVSLSKPSHERGAYHPITLEFERWAKILTGMGFSQIDGPEIDYDKYNFELVNIPKDSPSRDMQDSYFITPEILLRTQTSNTQPRAMEKIKPPFKVFSYGMVFRKDDIDATHTASFHQLEGIYIDENVGMADLKNMLEVAISEYLGGKTEISFRPSYFPFTEPSVEVDAVCPVCKGKGCASCKGAGKYEILGGGLIHPKVLELNGIDSKKYSGFAFGLGFDRFPKMKYDIPYPQLMYDNDVRFLRQFK